MRKERLLTAVKFAEEAGISYPTIVRWLKRGLVPGAQSVDTPMGKVWQIPESALKMERPKAGRIPSATKKADEAEMRPAPPPHPPFPTGRPKKAAANAAKPAKWRAAKK